MFYSLSFSIITSCTLSLLFWNWYLFVSAILFCLFLTSEWLGLLSQTWSTIVLLSLVSPFLILIVFSLIIFMFIADLAPVKFVAITRK